VEGRLTHEPSGRVGHQDLDLGSGILESTQKKNRLERGHAAGDTEEDLHAGRLM
jgi:hypothetical protein